MKSINNKRASTGEAIGLSGAEIIGWIILFALVFFAFLYFSGFGNNLMALFKGI